MPASIDEIRARAWDFLRDAHLELPRSAERRLMFALETFRTTAHAAGRAEGEAMSETDALMAMANALRSDDGHTLSVRLRVAAELEAIAARAPAPAEVSETDELVRKKLCAAAARLEQDLRLGRCSNNFEAILAFGIAAHAEGVREEREAAAKIAFRFADAYGYPVGKEIATAIRGQP